MCYEIKAKLNLNNVINNDFIIEKGLNYANYDVILFKLNSKQYNLYV